jgi:hypothetical protein
MTVGALIGIGFGLCVGTWLYTKWMKKKHQKAAATSVLPGSAPASRAKRPRTISRWHLLSPLVFVAAFTAVSTFLETPVSALRAQVKKIAPQLVGSGYESKIVSGDEARAGRKILANMAWVADGPDTGRHVYVLFSPDCSVSEKLFDDTRITKNGVQWRWILLDPTGEMASFYEKPGMESIRALFKDGMLPADVDPERTARIHEANILCLNLLLSKKYIVDDVNKFGVPAIVFGDDSTLSTIMGLPGDMWAALREVPNSPDLPSAEVKGAERFADRDDKRIPVTGVEYVNTEHVKRPVRVQPFKDAPQIAHVLPEAGAKQPLPVAAVSEEGFVYVTINQLGQCMFVEDPDFVKQVLAKK